MKEPDIHNIDKRLENVTRKLINSTISKQDKELILKFRDYNTVIGLSKHRITTYVQCLRQMAEWMQIPLESATKEYVMDLVLTIQKKDYSEYTRLLYKTVIKKFYQWLRNKDTKDSDEWIMPVEVKWIKLKIPNNKKKLPEELISIQDVEKMIKAADHPRDKALVSLLYEGGFRIEELLTLCIKNVAFDEYGAKIMIRKGKTGMRSVRIVASTPYLSAWIENHPFGDDPEMPLWIGIGTRNKNNLMCYESARDLVRKIAQRADIKKRIHLHLFRHSRATYLSKKKFSHEQMCQYFGWIEGSDMPSHYTHLAGRDIEEDILRINGIKVENEEDKHEFTTRKCPRCKETNPPVGKFCRRCGTPLDLKTMMGVEEKRKETRGAMEALLNDPEIFNLLVSKMKEKNLQAYLSVK